MKTIHSLIQFAISSLSCGTSVISIRRILKRTFFGARPVNMSCISVCTTFDGYATVTSYMQSIYSSKKTYCRRSDRGGTLMNYDGCREL